MGSVSQITHSGIFNTGTVAIVTTQVDGLKGVRLTDCRLKVFRLKGFRLKAGDPNTSV
jgi:hypothetical protein